MFNILDPKVFPDEENTYILDTNENILYKMFNAVLIIKI